jgi:hypothetical protein
MNRIITDMTIERSELPESIDTRMLAQLHRTWYGDIDPNDPDIPIDEERDRYFKMHLDGLNKVRRTLIDGNDFYDVGEVARLASGKYTDITQGIVHHAQERGSILAVPDHGRLLFPTFQFHARSTAPSPLIKYVHDTLSDGRQESTDPWEALSYWDQPRVSLGGQAFKNILWEQGAKRQIKQDMRLRTDTSGF